MAKKKTTAKKSNGASSKGRAVLVTTEHRGVFFGYARKTDGETIDLKASHLCVYWSADVKGFMGLAANGPTSNCRIGPAADITLRKITAVLTVTPEAERAWLGAPWKS
jgi:hypothetical protein